MLTSSRFFGVLPGVKLHHSSVRRIIGVDVIGSVVCRKLLLEVHNQTWDALDLFVFSFQFLLTSGGVMS